jgi:T5orf172 domain
MTDNRTVGFVYVLSNRMMPGLVKVGQTLQLIEDRARGLYRTGVPVAFDIEFGLMTSHPRNVEAAAFRLLEGTRLHKGREFFEASIDEAIGAVHRAATEVGGLQRWADEGDYHRVRARDRVALTTMAGQLFVHVYYPDSHAVLTNQPNIADIWQAHSDGDSLELMAVTEPNAVISAGDDDPDNSWTDPVPYLDRAQTFPNAPINGKERIRAGDRLIWLGVPNDRSVCRVTVFDFDDDCQVISRTRHPQTIAFGDTRYPLLLNTMNYEEIPPEMLRAARRVLKSMTTPRCWAPRDTDPISLRESTPQPPQYWLPVLAKRDHSRRG